MTLADRERLIRSAIVKAKSLGYTLKPGNWGVIPPTTTGTYHGTDCCPLGALILGERFGLMWGTASGTAAKKLGVEVIWVDSFTDGFDGNPIAREAVQEAHDLGAKLRGEYERGEL